MSADGEDLVRLIRDALNAATPEDLELALARVIRHPDLSGKERNAFHAVCEELSDTLLKRWLDLHEKRDFVAWDAHHWRGRLETDHSTVSETGGTDRS